MADPESHRVGSQHRLRTTESRCKVGSMALVMEPVSKWTTGQVVNWMKGREGACTHTDHDNEAGKSVGGVRARVSGT